MLKVLVGLFLLALAAPAAAQQGQVSPEKLAHQIDDAVWGMAEQIRSLEATVAGKDAQIANKDDELAKARDRIHELEGKKEENH